MTTGKVIMKISELADTASVSKQTIHFYLREGLLSPPVQTSRNMAYYDSRHVAEIRLIKELQEERYLPLAVIKTIVDARRNGQDFHLPDHVQMMEEVFFVDAKNIKQGGYLRLTEVLSETGLQEKVINKLSSIGLLNPIVIENESCYDSYEVALLHAICKIISFGLDVDDLAIYSQLLILFRTEARIVHNKIINNLGNINHPPLKDIDAAFMYVKSLLAVKVKRELIMEHRQTESKRERNGEVV